MKTLHVFYVVLFVFSLSTSQKLFAQAEIYESFDVEVYLTKKNENGVKDTLYSLTSGIEKIVISSSSKVLRTLSFSLDKDHPLLELANPVAFIRMTVRADFNNDGIEDELVDKHAIVTRNGKFKIVYHGSTS